MTDPAQSERIVEADAILATADALRRHGMGSKLLLVCDDATWHAAGLKLQEALGDDFTTIPHSLGRSPQALLEHTKPIIEVARNTGADALVAIGTGTINDITKYAAYKLGCDYVCVATGASMNGFSSATASLQDDNLKISHVCAAPKAVIADLRVIAAAPKRLARAGVGDTLCRSTVAADRYISHVIGATPFEREIFEQLRVHEQWLMENAQLLREGSMEYMLRLMHALLDAGDAMSYKQSSAVASQGEHMIAHTMEMIYGKEMREMLHGELIAVTSTSMAHLQHKILLSQPSLRHLPREEATFTRYFGKSQGLKLMQAYQKKIIPEADIEAVNAKFQRDWPDIKAELMALIVPANGIERAFKEAGLATTPQGIGLMMERYNSAMTYAFMTRERFTFLDIAAMNARRV